ncbi:hypothetical protein Taro_035738 [Colocasia esculenta]|uniref:Iron-sulphur binding protein LdpA C-terminal domain-containing protein n=1 Tax=Colocasia esculenta TaxID=4460 RepID=A0A843WFQ0_COLES|nr:hypothetical protein [Colocasia esculenta]
MVSGPRTYIRDTAATSELLRRHDVDAIEIHTSGRLDMPSNHFNRIAWQAIHLGLVASPIWQQAFLIWYTKVSLPHAGESVVNAMNNLYSVMETSLQCHNLWQLDGRPMSGDIGRGATKDAINFAVHLAAVGNRPPGFLQLAGGTNSHTVDCLKKVGLFQTWAIPDRTEGKASFTASNGSLQALIGGVAYGGYARKVVGQVLNQLSTQHGRIQIEDYPEHLLQALREALSLVGPVKRYQIIV